MKPRTSAAGAAMGVVAISATASARDTSRAVRASSEPSDRLTLLTSLFAFGCFRWKPVLDRARAFAGSDDRRRPAQRSLTVSLLLEA